MSFQKIRWLVLVVLVAVGAAIVTACGGGSGAGKSSSNPVTGAATVKHVFMIVLENKSYDETWNGSQSPYLQSLRAQGAFVPQYWATGHVSLDNYISMISGQPPTAQTTADCFVGFNDFVQTGTTNDSFKLPIGDGCVYPANVKTLPDQLSAAGLTWKGYMEDMGNDPTRESTTCGHPAIGAIDNTQTAQGRTHRAFTRTRSWTCTLRATTRSCTFIPSSICPRARPTWCH